MDKQLNADAIEKLQTFQRKRVMHLKLEQATDKLLRIEGPSYEGRIGILVGPSGAGKSTAVSYVGAQIAQRYTLAMKDDPGLVPVTQISLQTGLTGDFNWKDCFIRILEAFNEPLIERKIISRLYVELGGEIITNLSRLVAPELRRAVRNCVKARHAKLMILDEASSLFAASTSNNYLLQFELVKSLVNEIKCRILMCGAYDLLKIEDFNGQLIRRTRIVHFERYHQSELVKGDKYGDAFKNVVASFFDAMPIPIEEGLEKNYEYFLLMSLGCVGNLKDWLIRALEAALLMPIPILTKGVLISTQMPKKHLLKMLREIKLGEEKMQDISTSILAAEMGFSSTPTLTSQFNRSSRSKDPEAKDHPRKTTPGRRAPSRDPVGREDA